MDKNEWFSKEKYFNDLIKELKNIKKDEDINPVDILVFFRLQSIHLLITFAKQMSMEGENKSVYSNALSLFMRLTSGDFGLMNSLLRKEGIERNCDSCPSKEECDAFNRGKSCSEDSKEDSMANFMTKLENDLGKWN